MQLKINVLTKIEENRKTTFYFIQPESKIILPIDVGEIVIDNTYIRTLNAFEISIESIHVYLYLEGVYYVYLRIHGIQKSFDINTTLQNALCILECVKTIDIYIETEILEHEGIKITKEMLTSYLDT